MTDDATATEPIFSAAEVAAFEESDKSVGKAIGLMLAALFSLFVPLMLSFWLGVGTTSSVVSDDKAAASADAMADPKHESTTQHD